MTTPASDMYGHTEKHIRYSTSLFQQEPTEVCILPDSNAEKSYHTSSSPSAYASFELSRWILSVGPLLRDTVPEYNNNNQNNK